MKRCCRNRVCHQVCEPNTFRNEFWFLIFLFWFQRYKKDYGGDLDSIEELHKKQRETFEAMRDYFLMEEMQKNREFDEFAEEYEGRRKMQNAEKLRLKSLQADQSIEQIWNAHFRFRAPRLASFRFFVKFVKKYVAKELK